MPPVPPYQRPATIRRRVQTMSDDAIRCFLMRQQQGLLLERLITVPPPPAAAEPPDLLESAPLEELTPALVLQHLSTPRELDRFWIRILDALESGEISRSDGRHLARGLGQIRQSLQQTKSNSGMKKSTFPQ